MERIDTDALHFSCPFFRLQESREPSQTPAAPALPKGEPSDAVNALHRRVYSSAPFQLNKKDLCNKMLMH